jgi:hypothetical protein
MKFSKKYTRKKMFLQKFYILINKQATPITNFNDEVTKLPASDKITRIDGTGYHTYRSHMSELFNIKLQPMQMFTQVVAVHHIYNHHCSIVPHDATML